MDPEKQPLLSPVSVNIRRKGFRPLTTEEVLDARQEVTWRRARFFLIITFWSMIAMMLSIVACLLISTPKCNIIDDAPTVPPVHLTLAPLMSLGRAANGL